MQIIFYIMIYIIGTLLGSFFTLAIYRIPKKQDITHTRSYCPSCNHRLNFLDLIPIFSYIFLGGKCRYCKEKIGKRYLLIELISGIAYTLFILSFKINIIPLNINILIFWLLITIYYSIIVILAGIEKETRQVPVGVIVFSFIFECIYITYLYILHLNIYRYIIYLVISIVLLILITLKNKNYFAKVIYIYILSMLIINNNVFLIILALNAIVNLLIYYMQKEKKNILPVFNICVMSLIMLVLSNFIN